MGARDENVDTVPPPAGEDDAYSATTKVGAMPAELVERLRAEGLLPEDASEPLPDRSRVVPRPGVPRPALKSTPDDVRDDVPSFITPEVPSVPPPPADLPVSHPTAPPPAKSAAPAAPEHDVVATAPLAVAEPSSVAPVASGAPAAIEPEEKPRKNLFTIVAIIVALAVALLMALARRHR